jgi:hypothetical protein
LECADDLGQWERLTLSDTLPAVGMLVLLGDVLAATAPAEAAASHARAAEALQRLASESGLDTTRVRRSMLFALGRGGV